MSYFVDVLQPDLERAAPHKRFFMLWPERWQAFAVTCPEWTVFKYDVGIIETIPDEQGVYAFLVQPQVASNLNVSYLMYIGQTSRTLRQRFREYLLEANRPKGRPLLQLLLNLYKDHLYFACAIVSPPSSPADLEEHLIKAFIPPMNDKLPVEVRGIVAALR